MARTNAMQKAREISESRDTDVERHLRALGPFEDEVLHSQVLCMTYVQRSITEGGVHIPDRSIEEDRFQGKIALVVAIGPGAFKDDKIAQFHGKKIELHDWVLVRPSDGLEIFVNGNSCRLFEDVDVKIRVKVPRLYW
jgi:co-chaperonin GroES (HSP10)